MLDAVTHADRRRFRPRRALSAALLLALSACSAPAETRERYTPDAQPPTGSVGELMRNLDRLLAQWTQLVLQPTTTRTRTFRRNVEIELAKQVKSRFEDVLTTLESSTVSRNREIAAASIGFAKEREALIPLLNALADPSPDVREKALLGLGVLGDANTPLDPLVSQLKSGDSDVVQSNAAFALYRLAQEGARIDTALPVLRQSLLHPNPAVRVQAAAALGEARDSASTAALVALLQDSRALVAAAAANALGRIGNPTAIGALIEALSGKEAALRIEARSALTRIAGGSDLGSEPGPWRVWLRGQEAADSRPSGA